jgi:CelD/BcsL family acetyltransferase involved in cellulose biosynthesis
LIDLHQRRRQSLDEPGCFASPPWANFHREVALELLNAGQLRLSILELDGRPVAAEYHLASADATYAYQGGIDPERCEDEPGQLSLILCIERALAQRHQRFELLRGDEPYKPHWRAEPTSTSDVEIVSPRTLSRWRNYSFNGLRRAGRLVRQFTNLLG